MIQSESILNVIDNSGVKAVKCIKVLGGVKKRYGSLGDILKVSVKSLRQSNLKKGLVKKGSLAFVLIVQTKASFRRIDGQTFKFLKNSGILIDKNNKPIATRMTSPICKEFRQKKFLKVLSLASNIL